MSALSSSVKLGHQYHHRALIAPGNTIAYL
jgi:hypothetical protein